MALKPTEALVQGGEVAGGAAFDQVLAAARRQAKLVPCDAVAEVHRRVRWMACDDV